MDKLVVTGGSPLEGEIAVSGAKNAVLPILAGTLLTKAPILLKGIPYLNDVKTIMELMDQMGAELNLDRHANMRVNSSQVAHFKAPYELVRTMRASILVLGPLLGRFGVAEVSLPGGCAIGSRPVDVHLEGMRAMGADISVANGFIYAQVKAKRLKGAEIHLGAITVTGTENLMMAAVLAEGKTVIYQAAQEPEVVDLSKFLNHLGAKIAGAGTDTITVEGVEELSGGHYTVMSDRIEAGTYLIAAAMTRGHIKVKAVDPTTMTAVLEKLEESGAKIDIGHDWIEIDMQRRRPKAVDISTAPYPCVPTDMQAQFMALNVIAEGRSKVTENVFENRFMHVHELRRMGAKIELSGSTAYCEGQEFLTGAPVMATDLRASASLVLAGLVARGETTVDRIYHVDRGYERIEKKLRHLGAKIHRIRSPREDKNG